MPTSAQSQKVDALQTEMDRLRADLQKMQEDSAASAAENRTQLKAALETYQQEAAKQQADAAKQQAEQLVSLFRDFRATLPAGRDQSALIAGIAATPLAGTSGPPPRTPRKGNSQVHIKFGGKPIASTQLPPPPPSGGRSTPIEVEAKETHQNDIEALRREVLQLKSAQSSSARTQGLGHLIDFGLEESGSGPGYSSLLPATRRPYAHELPLAADILKLVHQHGSAVDMVKNNTFRTQRNKHECRRTADAIDAGISQGRGPECRMMEILLRNLVGLIESDKVGNFAVLDELQLAGDSLFMPRFLRRSVQASMRVTKQSDAKSPSVKGDQAS